MAASFAKNHIERRENKLFPARSCGAAFARNDMLSADDRARRAFWLRFDRLLVALIELKVLTEIIIELIAFRLTVFFLYGLFVFRRPGNLVVDRTLFFIGQDLVSIQNMLEFFGRFAIAGISVRVITEYRLSVGSLNFVGRGATLDTEQRVVIKACIHLLAAIAV